MTTSTTVSYEVQVDLGDGFEDWEPSYDSVDKAAINLARARLNRSYLVRRETTVVIKEEVLGV